MTGGLKVGVNVAAHTHHVFLATPPPTANPLFRPECNNEMTEKVTKGVYFSKVSNVVKFLDHLPSQQNQQHLLDYFIDLFVCFLM